MPNLQLSVTQDTCKRGHLFTPENTYMPPVGSRSAGRRRCRKCRAESNKHLTARRKLATPDVEVTKRETVNGTILLYKGYKEPLRRAPTGYGYMGCVAMSADKTLIQCHICGGLYMTLNGHLKTAHHTTADEYKQEFGLGKTTALISDSLRERMIAANKEPFKPGELPDWLQDYNHKVQSGEIKHNSDGHKGGWNLERRNKEGICPDQLLEKITSLKKKLGHTPSLVEFNEEYGGRFEGAIRYAHGSYLAAVKKAGLTPARDIWSPPTEVLIQRLQDFVKEHGRQPMTSDFKRGLLPPRAAYWRRFGSLNNARVIAGLPAIMPMGRGTYVELSPDQYMTYKETRHYA